MSEITAEPWLNLLRLVSENISQECLVEIMSTYLHVADGKIFKLNIHQAQRLFEVLSPLVSLRRTLMTAAQEVSDAETSDKIVLRQLDSLAITLVRKADFSLFPDEFDNHKRST